MARRGGKGGFGRKANAHHLKLAADTGADVSAISSLHMSLAERPPPLFPEYPADKMPVRRDAGSEERYLFEKALVLSQRMKQSPHHLAKHPPVRTIERYSDLYQDEEIYLSNTLAPQIKAGFFPLELTSELETSSHSRRNVATAGQFAAAGFVAGGAKRRMRSLSGAMVELDEKERQQGGSMPPPAAAAAGEPATMARRLSVSSTDTNEGDDDYIKNYYNSDDDDGGGDDAEPTM